MALLQDLAADVSQRLMLWPAHANITGERHVQVPALQWTPGVPRQARLQCAASVLPSTAAQGPCPIKAQAKQQHQKPASDAAVMRGELGAFARYLAHASSAMRLDGRVHDTLCGVWGQVLSSSNDPTCTLLYREWVGQHIPRRSRQHEASSHPPCSPAYPVRQQHAAP